MASEFRLRRFKLSFHSPEVERAFRDYDFPRVRKQGRTAILVGMTLYLVYGMLDPWFVPAEARSAVLVIRLVALLAPTAVLTMSFRPMFLRVHHVPLALVGLAAGLGLIAMLALLPMESVVYYYVGLVLVTFYTYNFIGTRFIYALSVDITLLLTYNLIFGFVRHFPLPVMINHDFFIVSANLIGGFTGYMAEHHRRQLFMHKQVLENERHFHQQRALHDPLTNLPNRELLFDRLERAIANNQRTRQLAAGIFIDLNDFKRINDMHGHACGDWVLREVARRLRNALRETDTVSRLGGDEFFVLAPEVESQAAIEALTDKILACIDTPLQPPGIARNLSVGAALGVCVFPFPECTAAAVLQHADQAMYRHKHSGKMDAAPALSR